MKICAAVLLLVVASLRSLRERNAPTHGARLRGEGIESMFFFFGCLFNDFAVIICLSAACSCFSVAFY